MSYDVWIIITYYFFIIIALILIIFCIYKRKNNLLFIGIPNKNKFNIINLNNLIIKNINFYISKDEKIFLKFHAKTKTSKLISYSSFSRLSVIKIFKILSLSRSNKDAYKKYKWINEGKITIYLSNKYIYLQSENFLWRKIFKYSTINEIKVDIKRKIYINFKNKREPIMITKLKYKDIYLLLNIIYTLQN